MANEWVIDGSGIVKVGGNRGSDSLGLYGSVTGTLSAEDSKSVSGVNVYEQANLTVQGGNISGIVLHSTGQLKITGGTVSSVSDSTDGMATPVITVTGGQLKSASFNTTATIKVTGGCVKDLTMKYGTLTVTGGTVEDSYIKGGQVYVEGGSFGTYVPGEEDENQLSNSAQLNASGGTIYAWFTGNSTGTIYSTTKLLYCWLSDQAQMVVNNCSPAGDGLYSFIAISGSSSLSVNGGSVSIKECANSANITIANGGVSINTVSGSPSITLNSGSLSIGDMSNGTVSVSGGTLNIGNNTGVGLKGGTVSGATDDNVGSIWVYSNSATVNAQVVCGFCCNLSPGKLCLGSTYADDEMPGQLILHCRRWIGDDSEGTPKYEFKDIIAELVGKTSWRVNTAKYIENFASYNIEWDEELESIEDSFMQVNGFGGTYDYSNGLPGHFIDFTKNVPDPLRNDFWTIDSIES